MKYVNSARVFLSDIPDGHESDCGNVVVNENNFAKLAKCANVKKLIVNRSTVDAIPANLIQLKDLTIMPKARVKELPPTLTNLTRLVITETRITVLPNSYSRLQALEMGQTRIKYIPGTYTELGTLYANKSKITRLPTTLVKLVNVNIDRTAVRRIPNSLINLDMLSVRDSAVYYVHEHIKYIDARGSKVWYLPPGVKQFN